MGFWDAISDLVDAATPWSVADAEAPPAEDKADESKSDASEESTKEGEDDSSAKEASEDKDESEDKEESDEEPEEEEEEEEDEDDDEPKDPKEELEEQCKESKQCHPAKHHYDECVERVTAQENEGGAKEDCVEEFFHLAHCATQCAAPKLWSSLK